MNVVSTDRKLGKPTPRPEQVGLAFLGSTNRDVVLAGPAQSVTTDRDLLTSFDLEIGEPAKVNWARVQRSKVLELPGRYSSLAIQYVETVCDTFLPCERDKNIALLDAARLVRIVERAEEILAVESEFSHVQREFHANQIPDLSQAVRGLCALPALVEPSFRTRTGVGDCASLVNRVKQILPRVVQKLIEEARRMIQLGLVDQTGIELSSLYEHERVQRYLAPDAMCAIQSLITECIPAASIIRERFRNLHAEITERRGGGTKLTDAEAALAADLWVLDRDNLDIRELEVSFKLWQAQLDSEVLPQRYREFLERNRDTLKVFKFDFANLALIDPRISLLLASLKASFTGISADQREGRATELEGATDISNKLLQDLIKDLMPVSDAIAVAFKRSSSVNPFLVLVPTLSLGNSVLEFRYDRVSSDFYLYVRVPPHQVMKISQSELVSLSFLRSHRSAPPGNLSYDQIIDLVGSVGNQLKRFGFSRYTLGESSNCTVYLNRKDAAFWQEKANRIERVCVGLKLRRDGKNRYYLVELDRPDISVVAGAQQIQQLANLAIQAIHTDSALQSTKIWREDGVLGRVRALAQTG